MKSRTTVALVFAATMMLAGFLLFQVQLVLGKFILPWFGGSASTWLVCLLFYQVALLAGYAHAYAITRPLAVERQVQLQLAILIASLLLLPIAPSDSWKPQDASDPTWRILGLLTVSVGLPYVALATTTPLLSRWLAHIEPTGDPVRLFAASNAGSFLGLLTYPFLVERLLTSAQQTRWWSWTYVVYAVLFTACGLLAWRRRARDRRNEAGAALERTANDHWLAWIAYAALGSALLMATTSAVTQWSAVVPFLWVVPLSGYLLTFVITFAYPRAYHRFAFGGAFLLLAGASFLQEVPESSFALFQQLALQAGVLLAGCMICHGELVRLRPEPVQLPKFYLAVAAGGALGGMGVVLLAPVVFSDYFEHPLVLFAIAGVALVRMLPPAQIRTRAATALAAAASMAGLFFVSSLVAGFREEVAGDSLVERVRNFYGVVKVVRRYQHDPKLADMALLQAGIDQGGQYQAPERRMQTICGFDEESGLGLALAYQAKRRGGEPLRIGVIGLGAGMIAALAREGDSIRYYEINPGVLHLTSRHFTFLRDSKGRIDVKLGDARLVLERQLKNNDPQNFDILVLDAFRGASPPMHLMTKEAFTIYLGHLAEKDYREAFSAHGIHLCTSQTEGFGHYINEARAIGALILALDAPPMNELIDADCGILIPTARTAPHHHGLCFLATRAAIGEAVATARAMAPARRRALGERARERFAGERQAFVERLGAALA